MKAFVDNVVSSGTGFIYLVRGTDRTDRPAWYYIRVNKLQVKGFLEAFTQEEIDLTQYGKIIVSGYGEEPSEAVKEEMRKKYSFQEGAAA